MPILEFLGGSISVFSLVFFWFSTLTLSKFAMHFRFRPIYAFVDKLELANKIQFDKVRAQRERVSTALNNAESTTEVGCSQPDEG